MQCYDITPDQIDLSDVTHEQLEKLLLPSGFVAHTVGTPDEPQEDWRFVLVGRMNSKVLDIPLFKDNISIFAFKNGKVVIDSIKESDVSKKQHELYLFTTQIVAYCLSNPTQVNPQK